MSNSRNSISRRHAVALTGALLTTLLPTRLAARDAFIFFDYQSVRVTDAAKKLIALVRQNIKPSSSVTVVGYCDTSEPDPDKLSLARAQAVAAELKRLNVPASAMTVTGGGTKQLLAKTGPNVREPQNRRVVIAVK